MTSVRGGGRPRRERSSAAPSVAPPNSSSPPKSDDELSNQPTGPLEIKPPIANTPAATSVPKYSEDDLQRILKAVLETQAPVPTPTPAPILAPATVLALAPALAPIIAKVSREKLKARSPDIYRGKSHMDYYNFCQQYEDYFATAEATGPTRILFATSILRDRISFHWQQYKQKHDADITIPVMKDEFKAFLQQSLGES